MPYGKGTYGSKVGRPKKKKTKVKDALYRGKIKKGPKKYKNPRGTIKKGPKKMTPLSKRKKK